VPFDSIISRADAATLIPEEQAAEVIRATTKTSAALALCRRATMGSKVMTQPVLSALPVASWVPGDTGLKQTTEAAWGGVTLTAEEIATIVPIPEAVLDDAAYDVWAEIRPLLAEAVALTLDAAVFAGINKPASWPEAIIPGATAAGNVGVVGAPVEEGGIYGDLEAALALVEADGYDPTGIAARRDLRSRLRKARSASGDLLGEVSTSQAWDLPISYTTNGTFGATNLAVAGDYSMAVLAIRQDLTYKVLDQAVITDNTGAVVYNLPQQDMLALRVVARFAFAVAKPVTRPDTGAGTPYPFAVLNTA
jgi:HK97 family phage major capsid protein